MPKWKPGESGNLKGRPRHVRERLTQEFITDLSEVWKKDGMKALNKLAKDDPSSFCKLAASLVPRDIKVQHNVNFVSDIIKLASQCSVEALELKQERVIDHVTETVQELIDGT